jgi:lipoate-protein ligase A
MMHGEYKTPGGKLVVADFLVRDGALRDVTISGDFFLYPDDALGAITAALEGAPSAATEDELAARVRAAVGPEVTMLGFSPEAIGRAVRRGVEAA